MLRWVCAPQYRVASTSIAPIESVSVRVVAGVELTARRTADPRSHPPRALDGGFRDLVTGKPATSINHSIDSMPVRSDRDGQPVDLVLGHRFRRWCDGLPRSIRSPDSSRSSATMATPRRDAGRRSAPVILFSVMDRLYGEARTLEKFRVLELVGPGAVPGVGERRLRRRDPHRPPARPRPPGLRPGPDARFEQDNEQWHLLILEELTGDDATPVDPDPDRPPGHGLRLLPTVVVPVRGESGRRGATGSTPTSRTTPSTSTPCSSTRTRRGRRTPTTGEFAKDFGAFDSLADLFRQIGYDERLHKLESEMVMDEARFG